MEIKNIKTVEAKKKFTDTFWTTIAFPKKLNFTKKIYNIDYKYIKIRFFKNY